MGLQTNVSSRGYGLVPLAGFHFYANHHRLNVMLSYGNGGRLPCVSLGVLNVIGALTTRYARHRATKRLHVPLGHRRGLLRRAIIFSTVHQRFRTIPRLDACDVPPYHSP